MSFTHLQCFVCGSVFQFDKYFHLYLTWHSAAYSWKFNFETLRQIGILFEVSFPIKRKTSRGKDGFQAWLWFYTLMVRGKKFNDCVKRDICGAMQEKSMGSLVREGRGGFIFILSGIAPAALCVCPHKRSCRKKASFMKPPFVGPTLEIMVIIGSEFAKIEEEDNIYQSERKTFTHFLTVTSRNPQHDCVKPRGGGQGPFTQCVKNIWFGRGWLPLPSDESYLVMKVI